MSLSASRPSVVSSASRSKTVPAAGPDSAIKRGFMWRDSADRDAPGELVEPVEDDVDAAGGAPALAANHNELPAVGTNVVVGVERARLVDGHVEELRGGAGG